MLGRVALIEHDNDRATQLRNLLNNAYLQTVVFADFDAIKATDDPNFDVILVASETAQTSGYQICHKLRTTAAFCDCVMIVYAPVGQKINWQNAFANRVDDAFICDDAPINIIARINRHLRKQRDRKSGVLKRLTHHYPDLHEPKIQTPMRVIGPQMPKITYWHSQAAPKINLAGLQTLGQVARCRKLTCFADLTIFERGDQSEADFYHLCTTQKKHGAVIAICAEKDQRAYRRLTNFGVDATLPDTADPWELALLARHLLKDLRHERAQDRALQYAIDRGRIDDTTQTLNKAFAMQIMDQLAQDAPKQTIGLIMLDIDNFKAVNDQYGHIIGDQVLAKFASHLKEHIRLNDILARFGGDEFLIILPKIKQNTLRKIVNRLRDGIAPLQFSTGSMPLLPIRFSVGMAHGDASDQTLLDQADQALLQEKATQYSTNLRRVS